MADAATVTMRRGLDEEGTELLLVESGERERDRERSWRLNFDGLRLSERREEPPPRRLHDCLGALGTGDVVAEYYQQQVEMLEGFNEMDALTERGFLPGMSKEERERVAKSEKIAIRLSNVANMVLFAAKVYASIRSGSLAIIASTLDSLLDLLSGFILWFTAFKMQSRNPYQYPIGKRRMQPLEDRVIRDIYWSSCTLFICAKGFVFIAWQIIISLKKGSEKPLFDVNFVVESSHCIALLGILVFASVMATLGLQMILESVRSLLSVEKEFSLTKQQEAWVVDIMLSVTLVKLGLVVYCRSFTNEIVKAYAQDHFFDVVTNVIGLAAALLANYIANWIDPIGAIILAIYTIRTWSVTVLENVNSLVGLSAAPEYLQKITYLCWNHDKAIRHIDTVRAYTFGSHYFVEVDIVLPSEMPLREAHDIGKPCKRS